MLRTMARLHLVCSSEDVAARIGFEPLDTRPLVQEQLAAS